MSARFSTRLEPSPYVSLRLVTEERGHAAGIERVLDRAFGPGRFAKSSERVRERGAVHDYALSRVALDASGAVCGVCRMWRVSAGGVVFHFLGPLAVDPGAQGEGVGLAIARESVIAAREAGGAGVALVGAEPFFRPLGFTQIPAGKLSLPGPVIAERFLWLEFRTGALAGAQGEIGAP